MSHKAQIKQLPDLIAGNLSRWQRWRLNRHLDRCDPCREELAQYEDLKAGIEAEVHAQPTDSLPGDDFMARVHQTIAEHPLPTQEKRNTPIRLSKLAMPAIAASLVALAIFLTLTFTGGNGASALSLATPVNGSVTIAQGGAPVADGVFAYVSPDLWERSTTYHRRPPAAQEVQEVSVDGDTYSKLGDGPWREIGQTPGDRQPLPGLTELGLAEQLFDAVLNVYELERDGRQDFRGETLDRYTGVDRGYAERIRDSALASGSSIEEANSQFEFYTVNPPAVTVLADESERIRAIFIEIQFADGVEPGLIEVTIDEFNATVDITAPAL